MVHQNDLEIALADYHNIVLIPHTFRWYISASFLHTEKENYAY